MNNLSRRFLFILCTTALLISYQNFSYQENPEQWQVVDPALLNQPQQSSDFAIPQNGHDLASVASDWSGRQKDLILQGRDQVILDSWNEKLQSFLSTNEDPESNEQESADLAENPPSKGSSRQPASIKFTQVNRVEYRVDESSSATCSFDGQGADFVFSKNLGPSKLELRHQSAQGSTSLSFNLPF
ncbi:MAG: hypothetical protein HUU57_01220 [Bdellovibrio sp.]|nr:hypothetical protein [Bdellovibrio sp.]